MGLEIRPAAPADASFILGLIRSLAEYEKLPAEASERQIADALFGPNPRVFCDIAEADGAPVGISIWFYSFSTFAARHGLYLEDLFVVPEARRNGAGLALMRRLARRCRDEGLARLEWQVLDWNAPAIAFYDRLGAAAKGEWINRSLAGAALAALAIPEADV